MIDVGHRVAIVGSGPAGVYAADILLERDPEVRIDIFEKLPAPYGLVRYGVSPDHPRIKKITDTLHEIVDDPRIGLFCNVELGSDVTIAELRHAYDAVVIATGADQDADLEVPGVELPGSFGGADFIAWYDGHPDAPTNWTLEAEAVAVIGAGNVALDVTRMLIKHARHLSHTDIPDHVDEALHANPVRDVHIFIRRGPADVRFSVSELRDLGAEEDVDMIVDPADMVLDEHAERMIKQFKPQRRIIETLTQWSGIAPEERQASGRVHLHFYQRPARILGTGRVEGIEMERTAPDPLGRVTGTGEYVHHEVGAVYRTIGYRSSPIPGVPFDTKSATIPEHEGRVLGANGQPVPGLYATGWVRRGPVGLIGSTKSDAAQTITSLLADLDEGKPVNGRGDEIENLHARLGGVVDWDGWLRIDAAERDLGQQRGRERTKIVAREELLERARRS